MQTLQRFGTIELAAVKRAQETAEKLISGFYVLAPREWERVHYEIRTLDRLAPEEICDQAFAQVLCYDRIKQVGTRVIEHHDLYRICLQDHRILRVAAGAARSRGSAGPVRSARSRGCGDGGRSERLEIGKLPLEPLLLYVLTHELIHIVRFSQRLQCLDLDPVLRHQEEISVEQTTRNILASVDNPALKRVIDTFAEL